MRILSSIAIASLLACGPILPGYEALADAPFKTEDLIPVSKAADYLHAVIQADRTIYSEYIVERLTDSIGLRASENWKEEKNLPLPAQFLALSAGAVEAHNAGLRYKLMSLWPINPKNAPESDFEKLGLEEILRHPQKQYSGIVQINGRPHFQAIYPDHAVTKSCAKCHNTHPRSPKRDFKPGDIMGGLLLSLPLGDSGANGGELIPAETVSNYVHLILEAERTAYAKHIVDRLQEANVIYASEHWWEENTLLLPAQYLLNSSDLIKNSHLGLDFRLISLWPINAQNAPSNDFEKAGLAAVADTRAKKPYTGISKQGGKNFFQAIYPDIAITSNCVSCHNAHPKSPKHDFKPNEVMGGIIISLPQSK